MTDDVPAVVRFPLPGDWLTLNQRHGWHQRHRLTKAWRVAGWAAAAEQLGRTPTARRRGLTFVRVSFPTSQPTRRRDPHNWAPTVKAIIDGFVDAGVWPDDTADQVIVLDSTFHHAPITRSARVEVHLYPTFREALR